MADRKDCTMTSTEIGIFLSSMESGANYLQAYRMKEAVLKELYGDEASSFALFPAYMERFKAANRCNSGVLKTGDDKEFQAVFFAPKATRIGSKALGQFYALDGTYTKSRYRMILLICCGIDANDHVLPIAWALVPIEDELWWRWFLQHLKIAFPHTAFEQFTFISDREKGITNALAEVFPNAYHLHCCQHLADNLQQRYGNKVRPQFCSEAGS
jgi:hypothetical protein